MKYNGPLIICGSARSGTTVLSRMIREHSQAFITMEGLQYSHNPNNFRNFLGYINNAIAKYKECEVDDLNRPQDRLGITIMDCKREGRSKQTIRALEEKQNQWTVEDRLSSLDDFWDIILEEEEIIYGDKRPEYIHELDFISSVWENAKFICAIRDPRDIWLSQVRNYKNKVAQEKRPHFWMEPTIEDAIYSDIQVGQGMNAIERMKTWESQREELDFLEVQYEKLCLVPEIILKKLSEFLNISLSGLERTYNKYFEPTHFQVWRNEIPDINEKIPEKYRMVMAKYGYY